MLRLYIKKQLRWSIVCAVVVCVALCIWTYVQHTSKTVYTFDFEKLQLSGQNDNALQACIDTLNLEVQERYSNVEYFTIYEGVRPEAMQESEDEYVENVLLVNREMIVWWNREMTEQAVYSDSLIDDQYLMHDITIMVNYQTGVSATVEQNIATYARNIKRYAAQPYRVRLYEKLQRWAEQMDIDFKVQNLSGISEFAKYISTDCTALVLILFSCFFMMEEFVHGNEGKQVLVSGQNLRFYTWKMVAANLLLALLEALLFVGVIYIIWGRFVFQWDVLKLPVQAMTDYADVVFPISIGQYLLICLGCHSLIYITLGAVLQVISLFSPNSTVSFAVSMVVTFAVGNFILSGLMNKLTTGRPFLQVGQYLLEYHVVLAAVCVVIILIAFMLVGVLTGTRIRNGYER